MPVSVVFGAVTRALRGSDDTHPIERAAMMINVGSGEAIIHGLKVNYYF